MHFQTRPSQAGWKSGPKSARKISQELNQWCSRTSTRNIHRISKPRSSTMDWTSSQLTNFFKLKQHGLNATTPSRPSAWPRKPLQENQVNQADMDSLTCREGVWEKQGTIQETSRWSHTCRSSNSNGWMDFSFYKPASGTSEFPSGILRYEYGSSRWRYA